ncbi:MAG TPA: nucleotide exchange factor GrpE [Thermoplasmatales archaeon]|nr:nucleotide exchange factor GrpE [Thermoplasmatales archaeon]
MSAKSTKKGKKDTSRRVVTKAELENRIRELEKEIKEKSDALLRAYADFQNYQKRVEKEIADNIKEAKKRLIGEILDIYELLEKTLEDKSPKEGIKSIIKKIEKLLEKENIQPIESLGKPFDHRLHYAVSTVKGSKDDIIVNEVKRGYLMDGELLRPSLVVVSKKED